jgi:hypothetical protein
LILSFLLDKPKAQPWGMKRLVVGLAPDDVHRVLILTLGKKPVRVPARRNGFFLLDDVNNPPEIIRFKP